MGGRREKGMEGEEGEGRGEERGRGWEGRGVR